MAFRRVLLIGVAVLPALASAQVSDPLPTIGLRALADSFGALRRSYIQNIDGEELVIGSLRGMMRSLEPEPGVYQSKSELGESGLDSPTDNGTGLQIAESNGQVVVAASLPDSSADRAGVVPGAVLYTVDGTPIGDDGRKANRLLRGPAGSMATVTLIIGEPPVAKTLRLERQSNLSAAIKLSMVSPDIAVATVTRMSGQPTQDLAKALTEQWNKAPFKAVVLDLRRNTGGELEKSIELAALFLPIQSVVVTTEGRHPESNRTYTADPQSFHRSKELYDNVPLAIRALPMVVLVDEGTGNGAELVAGSLRDNKRARLVGRKTFGRTSIEVLQPLQNGGAIRFTGAYWFPPSHVKIEGVGITPDRLIRGRDSKRELSAAIDEVRTLIR